MSKSPSNLTIANTKIVFQSTPVVNVSMASHRTASETLVRQTFSIPDKRCSSLVLPNGRRKNSDSFCTRVSNKMIKIDKSFLCAKEKPANKAIHDEDSKSMNTEPEVNISQDTIQTKNLDTLVNNISIKETINKKILNETKDKTNHLFTQHGYISIRDKDGDKKFSQGGYGIVSEIMKNGKSYAVKSIDLLRYEKERKAKKDRMTAQVNNEINHLKNLKDCNFVINFIESFASPTHFELILEYAEKSDLSILVNRIECLNPILIKFITIQLISALKYLGIKNIIHRDIKPANILVLNNFKIKLCDFMTAVDTKTTYGQEDLHNNQVGTFDYMAPEIFEFFSVSRLRSKLMACKSASVEDVTEQNELTQAIDYWSLGCVIYYMIQVKSPFSRMNRLIQQKQKLNSDRQKAMEIINKNNKFKQNENINPISSFESETNSPTPNKSSTTVISSKSNSSKKSKSSYKRRQMQISNYVTDKFKHVKIKFNENRDKFHLKSLSFKSEKLTKNQDKIIHLKSSSSVSKIECTNSETCSLSTKSDILSPNLQTKTSNQTQNILSSSILNNSRSNIITNTSTGTPKLLTKFRQIPSKNVHQQEIQFSNMQEKFKHEYSKNNKLFSTSYISQDFLACLYKNPNIKMLLDVVDQLLHPISKLRANPDNLIKMPLFKNDVKELNNWDINTIHNLQYDSFQEKYTEESNYIDNSIKNMTYDQVKATRQRINLDPKSGKSSIENSNLQFDENGRLFYNRQVKYHQNSNLSNVVENGDGQRNFPNFQNHLQLGSNTHGTQRINNILPNYYQPKYQNQNFDQNNNTTNVTINSNKLSNKYLSIIKQLGFDIVSNNIKPENNGLPSDLWYTAEYQQIFKYLQKFGIKQWIASPWDVVCGDDEIIIKMGVFKKRRGWYSIKTRMFLLTYSKSLNQHQRGLKLAYYDMEIFKAANNEENLELRENLLKEACKGQVPITTDMRVQSFSFRSLVIETPGRVYYLDDGKNHDVVTWKTCLENAVKICFDGFCLR